MKKIISNIFESDFVRGLAMRIISHNIIHSTNKLSKEYLLQHGWVENDGYVYEPNLKEKRTVWINFGDGFYRIFYGEKKTFIALESSFEYFQLFMLTVDNDKRYQYSPLD